MILGKHPWPARTSTEVLYEAPAARESAPYRCQRGCEFTVTFHAGVVPPAEWTCRCGQAAVYTGTAATAPPPGRRSARWMDEETEHQRRMAQVLGRRSRAELEELLTKRLAELHRDTGQESCGPG